MIEIDIVRHLSGDEILMDLLSATVDDKKIYPYQAEQGSKVPFLVYEVLTTPKGYSDLIDEDTLQFNIFCEKFDDCLVIENRLRKLLEISDELRISGLNAIPSDEYIIYNGVSRGASAFRDFDTGYFVKVIAFSFKYKRKVN